jgi:hypothetical protein
MASEDPTQYDTEGDYEELNELTDENFDNFTLQNLLHDYKYADPASRYEVAKNSFERTLNNAKVGMKSC